MTFIIFNRLPDIKLSIRLRGENDYADVSDIIFGNYRGAALIYIHVYTRYKGRH